MKVFGDRKFQSIVLILVVIELAVFFAFDKPALKTISTATLIISGLLSVPCFILFSISRSRHGDVTDPETFKTSVKIFKYALAFFLPGVLSFLMILYL